MGNLYTHLTILFLAAGIVIAGCTESRTDVTVPPSVAPSVPSEPGPLGTVPAATGPGETPREIVTLVRYISPEKDVRDPTLLFALKVPADWNVSTTRMQKADTSDYRTDLVGGNRFVIESYYADSRSREQEYRDRFRQWYPAPRETTVMINDIRFDRFESSAGGNTTVAYLSRTNNANERGYASVLIFTSRDCNRFEQEDFEKVISSFRYYSRSSGAIIPGDEIPLYDISGTPVSHKDTLKDPRMFDSSDWDTGEGGSSGEDSSAQDSSGGGSTGGGCNR